MATGTTTSTSGISTQYQKLFDKQLLQYAIDTLRLNEFAQQAEMPKNLGTKIVSFFRYGTAASSNVQTLSEGTVISTDRVLTLTKIDATLAQYGQYILSSDILSNTQLFDLFSQAAKTMGEEAALKADDLSRLALNGASSTSTERFAQGFTTWAALAAAANTAGFVDSQDILDAATNLKVNKAPMINGSYVGILAPQITRDLMRDPDWLAAAEYSDATALYKGEIGSLYGVRILEATNPQLETTSTQYTYNSSGTIFCSNILGANAFGVAKLSGDSPMSPSMVVVNTPDKADPLNQTMTIGWKAFYTSVLLNGAFAVGLRSFSRYA